MANGSQAYNRTDITREPWRWAASGYKPPPADRLALQNLQPNVDITSGRPIQTGFGDVLAALYQRPTTTTTAPQPDRYDQVISALLSGGGGGTDIAGAVNAMRNTPVADYAARQQIAGAQAASAGLAATAAEDAARNRAIAQNVVATEFPGQTPTLGTTLAKMLPESQEMLRALPSGGYAVTGPRSSAQAEFAGAETKRRAAGDYLTGGLGPPLKYGSSGNITDVGSDIVGLATPPIRRTRESRMVSNFLRRYNPSA